MSIHPLFDCVALQRGQAEKATESGFILTHAADERPQYATVVAVGPGGIIDGQEVQMLVHAGQKVAFASGAGTALKLGENEYILVRQKDLLAILD